MQEFTFPTSFRTVCHFCQQAFWQWWAVASVGCYLHFPGDWWPWTLFTSLMCFVSFENVYSYFAYFYIGSSAVLLIWISHTLSLLTLYQTHCLEVPSPNMPLSAFSMDCLFGCPYRSFWSWGKCICPFKLCLSVLLGLLNKQNNKQTKTNGNKNHCPDQCLLSHIFSQLFYRFGTYICPNASHIGCCKWYWIMKKSLFLM